MQTKREFILTILAPSLIFLSGFLTYILHQDYGVFSLEVILSMALIGLAGILVGIPLAIAGQTRFRAFCFAVMLFFFFDIQFHLIELVCLFIDAQQWKFITYLFFSGSIFIILLVILASRKHIATITITIFTTVILSSIILPVQIINVGEQPVSVKETPLLDLPPVIHIVLDGHVGIEGIPLDIDGGRELRDTLIEFYTQWGFRLYGRAYSRYRSTHNSLSNMFNGTASDINGGLATYAEQAGTPGWRSTQNLYFKKLKESGHRILVFQSDYYDFCQDSKDAIEFCYRYPSSSPQILKDVNLPALEKASLILGSYFSKSAVYDTMRINYNIVRSYIIGNNFLHYFPKWEHKNYAFSSLGIPGLFDRLKKEILRSPRGRVFFAHILFPHAPYTFNNKCDIRADSDTWLNRRMEYQVLESLSNPLYRDRAYELYFEQVYCTVTLLNDLFVKINETDSLEDAVIIIHGDHGSRITISEPVSAMKEFTSERDYIDSFSTLFAIRSPYTMAGYDDQLHSIQNLFAELVLKTHKAHEDGSVFLLTGEQWRKLPMNTTIMPAF